MIPIGKILSEEKIVLYIGQSEIKISKLAMFFVRLKWNEDFCRESSKDHPAKLGFNFTVI